MRVLVTSTPGLGHLNVLAPLVVALQVAGHEALVVTAQESCHVVEQYGFAVRPGGMSVGERRRAFAPRLAEVMALPPRQRRTIFFTGLFAEAAAPVMHQHLGPVFDDFEPDIVINEMCEMAAGPMALARGIPHVTVAFSGALPCSSDASVVQSITPIWEAEGLSAPTVDDIRGSLYLHPFPPSFGQAPTGAMVRGMRAEGYDGGPPAAPTWLDDIGRNRPVVYLTFGTELAAAAAPWAAAIEALGQSEIEGIVTIGSHLDPAALGTVASNLRIERFVPQKFILGRASVVMSHAGAGTLLGAALAGVPQLLNPVAADQWENADAATGAGVAITCELDRRTSDDIAAALDRLLHEQTFALAASRVAAEIAAMPAPFAHVAIIEALATGSGKPCSDTPPLDPPGTEPSLTSS